MAQPQKLEGSRYQVLRIRNTFLVFFASGLTKVIENMHYYGPGVGQCYQPGASPWSASQKAGLITYSAGVAGPSYNGISIFYGFQTTVAIPLNCALSIGALPNGIFAKWLDVITDPDEQKGTLVPSVIPPVSTTTGTGGAGLTGGVVTGDRLPLDNHVTVRKITNVAGKEFSRGRWKFAPIAEGDTTTDELNATGKPRWNTANGSATNGSVFATPSGLNLKQCLYQPITDGSVTGTVPNLLYPILVSGKLSQLRRAPTRIIYAPLVLPGLNYMTQVKDAIINSELGEQRRRKEKTTTTF